MADRPCKLCGMKIDFIEGPAGVAIPAQKIRTIYRLRPASTSLEKFEQVEPADYYVSHFETCPNAGAFSRKGK